MADTNTELKTELKKGIGRLQALRDEVRVKIHLASLTLKDQWSKMEPRLEEVERAAQDITETSRTALTDALKRLEQLRDNLRNVATHGSGGTPGSGNTPGAGNDTSS